MCWLQEEEDLYNKERKKKIRELVKSADVMLDVLSRAGLFVCISTAIGAVSLKDDIDRAIDSYVAAFNEMEEQ